MSTDKPVQRCRHCKRWRPYPYIPGEWISPEVTPPRAEYQWVTYEDCCPPCKGYQTKLFKSELLETESRQRKQHLLREGNISSKVRAQEQVRTTAPACPQPEKQCSTKVINDEGLPPTDKK